MTDTQNPFKHGEEDFCKCKFPGGIMPDGMIYMADGRHRCGTCEKRLDALKRVLDGMENGKETK